MIRIAFDTNVINALENVDREPRNTPDIKDYAALLNMILYRQKGKCKIFNLIFVQGELLDNKKPDRNHVRRHLILYLLDKVNDPKVMYRNPDPNKLTKIFGPKDGAIVFECVVRQIDYLITRDSTLIEKAKNYLNYHKPKVLSPKDANGFFINALPDYVDHFKYLSENLPGGTL